METKIFNFKFKWLLVPLVLISLGVGDVWGAEEYIIPKLYLTSKNTPSGNDGWTFIDASTDNANTDYWKMVKNTSVATSPSFNISNYTNVTVSVKWQNFGAFDNSKSNATIKISTGSGTWYTLGTTGLTTAGTTTTIFSNVETYSSYSSAQIQISTPNADGSAGGRLFVVEIKGEVVVTTAYTVTLKDDNSTLTEASAGAGVTLPSRDGCTGYTFAGWTKSWATAQTTWTTTAPTIIPAGSYTPSANENLYPVYTKTESGGVITLFSEDFAALTTGNDATTSGPSNTATSTSTLTKFSDMSNVYPAGGIAKLGGKSSTGYLTTNTITAALGDEITISFKVKGWTTVEGNIQVESGNGSFSKPSATSYTSTISDSYQTKSVTVTLTKANPTVKIGTTAMRAFIDDLVITKGGSTTYYISVPNCCSQLGSINGSITLSQKQYLPFSAEAALSD